MSKLNFDSAMLQVLGLSQESSKIVTNYIDDLKARLLAAEAECDTWAGRASQYVSDEQTYGTHRELAKELTQCRAERSEAQKQFGLCFECNKAAWVTRADGKTEDCEVCRLRAELEQARKWLAERPSETLHRNRVEEIGLLKARNALLEKVMEAARALDQSRPIGEWKLLERLTDALTAYDQAEK